MNGRRLSRETTFGLALLALGCSLGGAQVPAPPSAAGKKDSLVILPVLFYSPETRWGGGVGGIFTFWPDRRGMGRRPSSVMFLGTAAESGQYELTAKPELYLAGDSTVATGNISWKKSPSKYFGLGNGAPEEGEEDFTPRQISFEVAAVKRLRRDRDLFAGVIFQVDSWEFLSLDPSGMLAGGTVEGAGGGTLSGAGAVLKWDSRNTVFSPRKGNYIQISAVAFGRFLGSGFGCAKIKADLRTYVPVGASHTLALQAYFHSAFGGAPFMALPMFGTDNTMRGYYSGRFRDNHMVAVQAEYRLPLFWRIGLVGFAAAGRVADRLENLSLSGMKPSIGWGVRYRATSEGANLRLDFGYGKGGASGMYLTAGEAF